MFFWLLKRTFLYLVTIHRFIKDQNETTLQISVYKYTQWQRWKYCINTKSLLHNAQIMLPPCLNSTPQCDLINVWSEWNMKQYHLMTFHNCYDTDGTSNLSLFPSTVSSDGLSMPVLFAYLGIMMWQLFNTDGFDRQGCISRNLDHKLPWFQIPQGSVGL